MTLRILQMKNSLRQIDGNWDLGFVLDKHKISSTPTGYNDYGHMQFDTIRTEVGEALFKLKYRNDSSQIQPLAEELANTIFPKFDKVGMLIPMPSSKKRPQQPVTELTKSIGKIVGKPVFDRPGGKVKSLTDFSHIIEPKPNRLTIWSRDEWHMVNALTVNDPNYVRSFMGTSWSSIETNEHEHNPYQRFYFTEET